jgi:hypothetical protein
VLTTRSAHQDGGNFRETFLKAQSPDVKDCMETLYRLHDEREELEKEFFKEKAELEAKYRQLYGAFRQA